jgi:F-type H+-transporting ATPase subunit gamma
VIGDKGRTQLRRVYSTLIKRTASEIEHPGSFALAAALTSELIAAGASDYDAVVVFYNSYVNAAVYTQKYKVIAPFSPVGDENESLIEYEFDGDKGELMDDLYEYMMASNMYYTFMDAAAAEQSSRMTAMENASKNAGEMIDRLTLQYNRARQARITTELIEIISGASALHG